MGENKTLIFREKVIDKLASPETYDLEDKEDRPDPKSGYKTICDGNYTPEETEFAVFCIENLADYLEAKPKDVYDALAKRSFILDDYIIPCYDILHTQGKEYIIENILDVMTERDVYL